ncbi:hypothetical protein GCM10010123_02240 [Pilimelia anulata]|uniref:GGDEF domain-containing protein n=1 Tax=Pilimelia anulata TaxID=53371 RepID=A0A8J3AYW0_9ACTN|nr:GGDEF domain-containing protein [Pilimelia anulata]GGJ75862.1 hypothetical protein GCM10010123_02240 [Pilimelia anulata]
MLTAQFILIATVGFLTGLALAVIPITSLRRQLREALHQAHHDALTGLPNRRHLRTRMRQAVAAGEPIAVAVLDLDGFKGINDRFGHGAGDDVIAEVARRLTATPGIRVAARLGGDEFALLIDQTSTQQVQDVVADAARRVLSKPVFLGRQGWTSVPGLSVGITAADPQATPQLLLHRADAAMYQAKTQQSGMAWHQPDTDDIADTVPERPSVRQRDRRTTTQP